jgi:HlyD family secretion protein
MLVLAGLTLATLLLGGCEPADENLMVGTLERDRIELRVEADEPIIAIEAVDGASVQAGEIILRQDTTRYEARLQQTMAQRDQAGARLAELRRGPRAEAIREAQARLTESEVVARNAEADHARARDIFERGLSNASALDAARAASEAARAREQANREALSALLHGTTVEELQQAQAALAAADAAVTQARLDMERLTVRAPLAGTIDKILYQRGERPARGVTIAVLLDTARTFARIYVPEHLRARMVPGTRLGIHVDGQAGPLPGTVRWVSADASFTPYFALTEHDRSRLSYLAEVDLENASGLPSGLPLEARLAD